jgi:predicted PurR-regulated permease PerM
MITRLIQRKTVSLPPALTLSAQVLLGVIFGGLGVALATPMTAAALVLSRMLYVDDTGVFKGTGYFSYATSNGTWVGPSP